ncbi:hypothetical protein ACHAWF_002538 [Thalassiosira exigua]
MFVTMAALLLLRCLYGIIPAAIVWPASINAYSFVPSRRSSSFRHDRSFGFARASIPPMRRETSASLSMKRPNPRRRRTADEMIAPIQEPSDVPANLKRHVVAKRPTLGHVVPKNSKTRRFKPPSSSESQFSQQRGGSDSAQLRPQGQSRDTKRYNNPSNLRILGGSVRGRKLESPSVYLRPMMGKVREAVFSTFTSFGLYDDVGGKSCTTRHLDIFSGSGSVGLESLSRGARHCTFVDMSADCCGTCERNVERCGFDGWNEGGLGTDLPDEGEPVARVVRADAFRALREPESVGIPSTARYDVVTLCPPYEEVVYADLLEAVASSKLVGNDTVILVEYPVELGCLPHVIGREDGGIVVGVRNRKYGRTVIAMYIVNPTGERESCESRPEDFISL